MGKNRLEWHEASSDKFVGICESLPDVYCHFLIVQINKDKFFVEPPTLKIEIISNRLPFRDLEAAKDFCEDFLVVNIRTILRHQIDYIKNNRGGNLETKQPEHYYQNILENLRPKRD